MTEGRRKEEEEMKSDEEVMRRDQRGGDKQKCETVNSVSEHQSAIAQQYKQFLCIE
jgi:hypothetical protein